MNEKAHSPWDLPHGNADSLELARVLGWQIVVKKGEFKAGDKVVYLEIDSVCPKCDWSLFLEKHGFRIKTIRLRGQLSQGLILPLTILGNNNPEESTDVTDQLSITKYESADEKFTINDFIKSYPFPINIGFNKTDEPRAQSMPFMLDLFRGKKWFATLKVDGTSATFFIDPETKELAICSRNNRVEFPLKEDNPTGSASSAEHNTTIDEEKVNKSGSFHLKYVMKNNQLKDSLTKYPHLVIQGELYGPKIQGNPLCVPELSLAVFSIYDMSKRSYCNMNEMVDYCNKLGLKMVDIIYKGDDFNFTIKDLLDMVKGKYPNSKFDREGLVFRLQDEFFVANAPRTNPIRDEVIIDSFRASFKVINNDYLEKEK